MKYAVVKCVNGSFFVHSEGWTDLEKAKVNFFALCQSLHSASDVQKACCMITDENFNFVEYVGGYKEIIDHTTNETTETPNTQ